MVSDNEKISLDFLLEEVLRIPPQERSAFLDLHCSDDEVLRADLESLLITHAKAGDFLKQAAFQAPPDVDATLLTSPQEKSGTIIDKYKLLESIGEGGFGTVWMAEQKEPVKRRVALKIIKLGMDTKQVIARFEAERQALALMDHPNIAKVFDAGATETGRPFFVMELIKGVPILEYCDTQKLDTKARLDLFIRVCNAIQHAHQKGIIHRDIKPSNVMITMHDGVPVPKVIDFGIAKATNQELTDKTLFTQHRQMIGTPAYMSPEQAEMSGLDIDTRSDIYSLGVLLYEMLTGTTPFSNDELMSKGYAEMMRIIRETEPHKPSTRLSSLGDSATDTAKQRCVDVRELGSVLRGDLDWIVMKCLEKDRTRRYDSANGLATDIQRHLNDEPVDASPPSQVYRFRKFVKRNRAGVIAATVVALVLVLGIAGTTGGMLWALSAEKGMQRELTRTNEVKQIITEMLGSINPIVAQGKDNALLKEILDKTAERLANEEIQDELIAAELHHVIGMAYRDIGLWDEADQHIPVAVEIRKWLLGEEDPLTLQSVHESISLCLYLKQFENLETLAFRNLELRKKVLGPEHPDTLASMERLAEQYGRLKRFDEVEALLLETLEIRTRVPELGPDHRDTLESMSHLGLLYLRAGRLEDAEPLLLESLEARRRELGENHPDVLPSMGNLAHLYRKQGRNEEAITLMIELRDTIGRVLGEKHPYTLRVMSEVGDFYNKLKRFDDACNAIKIEFYARRYAQGMQHQQTLRTLRDLGRAYEKVGRLEDELALYRESLANLPSTPDDAEASPMALFTVGWILTRNIEEIQEPIRAIEFAQRAVDLAQLANSRSLYKLLDLLALALHQKGDNAKAIESQKRAIEFIPKQFSPGTFAKYESHLSTYEAALAEQGSQPGD
ncbi:MAG: serine/threonine protein kinase [Planctomycetes bacterium]|nr:serine/threonine protein kinase [Planctomycetota bacterium]